MCAAIVTIVLKTQLGSAKDKAVTALLTVLRLRIPVEASPGKWL